MDVRRFAEKFLLLFAVIQLVYARNHFHIQQDSVVVTTNAGFAVSRLFIVNNNLNILINLTIPLPTNANMVVKAWHRNPRGKYDTVGIPWSINGCQFIETDRIVYDGLRKLKNTKIPEKCPIQPARYFIKDYDVNQITIPIVVPMGHYRIQIRGVTGKTEIIKVIWNGQLIPE